MKKKPEFVCVIEHDGYKPGDPAPDGYLAWHAWAEVQHKAGLRQKQCGRCTLWRYPQQLSPHIDRTPALTRAGLRTHIASHICLTCAAKDLKLCPAPAV